uniref:Ig-like domain-containing protein n=1 Tax=Haplochromis burtoni TaxID=8153 RepID=A0A3Q2V763_HAPBU
MNVEDNQILSQARGSLGLSTLQEKVQGIPPAFLKPLMKKNVFENDTLTFYAEVFGLPSPEVNWFRNKTQLVADDRVTIERDGDSISLTIQNVTRADQGEYICEAVNYVGEARSVAVVVVVSQEVRFTPAVSHQCSEGTEASFNYKVSGDPVPDIKWFKGGPNYEISFSDNNCTLRVLTLKLADSGAYKCKAVNKAGTTETTAFLVVRGQYPNPSIPVKEVFMLLLSVECFSTRFSELPPINSVKSSGYPNRHHDQQLLQLWLQQTSADTRN